jgi:hypothetical protein
MQVDGSSPLETLFSYLHRVDLPSPAVYICKLKDEPMLALRRSRAKISSRMYAAAHYWVCVIWRGWLIYGSSKDNLGGGLVHAASRQQLAVALV